MQVIDRYKNHSNVRFMMYSNGFNMPPKMVKTLLEMREKKVGPHPKFFFQLSYDGQPVHDIKRKRVLGGTTAQEVRNSVEFCKGNLIPFSIKSTITLDTLKYMYDAYTDVNELVRGGKTHLGFGYFPTLDYLNDIETNEQLDQYIDDMKQNLKRIASSIVLGKRQGKQMMPFRWFDNTKANCSAGINMFSINTDGNIYVCHGCMYTPTKDDHLVGTVDDDLSVLDAATTKHLAFEGQEPPECAQCAATFCVRCNALRYSTSDLPTYGERWKDYTNRPDLCRVYEEAGKVARAFQKLL
jgi:radical SAM protein with 4Fe4S-binding SPASM domain